MLINRPVPAPFLTRIQTVLRDHRLGWAMLLILSLAPLIGVGYGHDFFMHYRRYTLSGEYGVTTWLPYYGYWLIYPFAIMPHPWGLAVWNLTNAAGLGWLCQRWRINPIAIATAFPTLYMFGNGQMEGIIAGGIALSLVTNPIIAGLGLVILGLKPQLTVFIAGYVLLMRWNWRLLMIPVMVLAASLAVWGVWIPEWILSLQDAGADIRFRPWNVSFFPYSLIVLPAVWAFRHSPRLLLVITPVIVPYYAIYSLALGFTVGSTWWLFGLTWSVAAIYVIGGYTPLWGLVIAGMVWVAYASTVRAGLGTEPG